MPDIYALSELLLDLWVNSAGAKMIVFIVLWTYGPYLSTVHLATARKQFFAARTTSAEISALAVRNCHPDQLVRDTVHTVQLDKVYSVRSCYSNIFDLLYLTVVLLGEKLYAYSMFNVACAGFTEVS